MILNANCIGCHDGINNTNPPSLPHLLNLSNVGPVIGMASSRCSGKVRIAPGSSTSSYLVDKLLGRSQIVNGCFMGARMPLGGTLSAADLLTIVSWIDAGAP